MITSIPTYPIPIRARKPRRNWRERATSRFSRYGAGTPGPLLHPWAAPLTPTESPNTRTGPSALPGAGRPYSLTINGRLPTGVGSGYSQAIWRPPGQGNSTMTLHHSHIRHSHARSILFCQPIPSYTRLNDFCFH